MMSKELGTEANAVFSQAQPNMEFIYQGCEHEQCVMRFLRMQNLVQFRNYFLSACHCPRISV